MALARHIARSETNRLLSRQAAQRRHQRHHADHAVGLHAGARRRIRADQEVLEASLGQAGLQRYQCGFLVAIMNHLQRSRGPFAQGPHTGMGNRGWPTIDVADDIGLRLEHIIAVDEMRARNRWTARMHDRFKPDLTAPIDNALRIRPLGDGTQADLADMADARSLEFGIDITGKAQFRHRCARDHLGSCRTEILEAALRHNRQRLDALRIPGATRQMHFARRNQRRDAAIHPHLDPADLVLARCPIANHRMAMAVDQAR